MYRVCHVGNSTREVFKALVHIVQNFKNFNQVVNAFKNNYIVILFTFNTILADLKKRDLYQVGFGLGTIIKTVIDFKPAQTTIEGFFNLSH